MTTLADIGNRRGVSKAMTVAALRGSDLEEFNEAHPRDAVGRFARVAESPSKDDPRIARMARLRRRQRRGAAESAGHQAAAVQAATDASALQGLRRERVLPPRRMPKVADPRVKVKEETKEETKPEPKPAPQMEIDDESYMNSDARKELARIPSVVFINIEQAKELLEKGSLVVTAAEKKWGTDLHSVPEHSAIVPAELMGSGLVAIRFQNPHWIDGSEEGMQEGRLAGAQSIQPLANRKSAGTGFTSTMNFTYRNGNYHADSKGKATIRVIDANAWSAEELGMGLHKSLFSKAVTAMEWDDADHPRDPDTGQFMRLHTGPGGPPSNPDPRISRERRRRRRQRRGLAEMAEAHREPEQREPEPRTLADVRALAHRPAAHRPAQVLMEGRVGLRQQDSGSPRELPLTRPQEKPQEETLGPRIHPWVGISPDVSTLAPAAPRVPKSKARNRQSYKLPRLRETAALGAVPRMDLVDEYGNHLNQADIDAWVAAVRARRARKARAARS